MDALIDIVVFVALCILAISPIITAGFMGPAIIDARTTREYVVLELVWLSFTVLCYGFLGWYLRSMGG